MDAKRRIVGEEGGVCKLRRLNHGARTLMAGVFSLFIVGTSNLKCFTAGYRRCTRRCCAGCSVSWRSFVGSDEDSSFVDGCSIGGGRIWRDVTEDKPRDDLRDFKLKVDAWCSGFLHENPDAVPHFCCFLGGNDTWLFEVDVVYDQKFREEAERLGLWSSYNGTGGLDEKFRQVRGRCLDLKALGKRLDKFVLCLSKLYKDVGKSVIFVCSVPYRGEDTLRRRFIKWKFNKMLENRLEERKGKGEKSKEEENALMDEDKCWVFVDVSSVFDFGQQTWGGFNCASKGSDSVHYNAKVMEKVAVLVREKRRLVVGEGYRHYY